MEYIMDTDLNFEAKKKLAFFVKHGLDNFLGDIISRLSDEYEVKKIVVNQLNQIDEGMNWADICWFEWCDELAAYGSKLSLAKDKKIICRLHSYEAFTNYPFNIEWTNIDKIIFVCKHIMENVLSKLVIPRNKCEVIYNGIDTEKFKFKERKKGYNIAFVGYINFKKGPMLLLHTFKAIYDADPRYKLYIAGQFQEERYILYFNQMIEEMGLQNNIFFEGWQNDINEWLEDKDYIICTSVLEGNPIGVMEAMAMGIKPLIHNFVGAREQFGDYVWNSIDECVKIITSDNYNSQEYSNFITQKFSLDIQITRIKKVLSEAVTKVNIIKYVRNIIDGKTKCANFDFENLTLLITCFNRGGMLRNDIEKGFKLACQKKLLVDDCSTKETEHIKHLQDNSDFFNIPSLIIHEKNRGLAGSRQTGYENITTDYTMVLDDDDMLFCFDENKVLNMTTRLKSDSVMLIPRYIINLYEDGSFQIGYDRIYFHEQTASNVLYNISATSEVKALLAGSISKTKDLLSYNPGDTFKVSEDFITLIKTFANNLDKKILVTEDLVHIRRIDSTSLSRTISENKLVLGLIAQAIGCYYCIKNNIFSMEKSLEFMRQRAALLQKLYGFGADFEEELIAYLSNEISEEIFIKHLCHFNIHCTNSLDEIAEELNDFRRKSLKKAASVINNNLPLISIIIDIYNPKEAYLREAIDSILAQDYPNIEIVITDDYSISDPLPIIENYKKYANIKYLRNTANLGCLKTSYNALYNIAKGEYALFLDQDDYLIRSDYLSKAVNELINNKNLSLVYANCKLLYTNSGLLSLTNYKRDNITPGFDYFVNYEIGNYKHITSGLTCLFDRKKAMELNCCTENTLCGDLFLWLKLMLVGDIGFIEDHAAVYRIHNNSLSSNLKVEYDLSTIDELESLRDMALEKGISKDFLGNWLEYRVFKYVWWSFLSHYNNADSCSAFLILESIKEKYPGAYRQIYSLYNQSLH